MKIIKAQLEARKVTYKGPEGVANFGIKPFPLSKFAMEFDGEEAQVNLSETNKRRFVHCVEWWDLEDEQGKPLPCNNTTKGQVFDYVLLPPEVMTFVRKEIMNINDEIANIPKNSSALPEEPEKELPARSVEVSGAVEEKNPGVKMVAK